MCVADPADGRLYEEAYNAKGGTGRFYVISLRNGEGSAAGYVVTSTDGDTALFVYPRGGGAKFFRPAIRQR